MAVVDFKNSIEGSCQMPNYWMEHVHLVSKDPLKTAEFYEKTLGAKMVERSTLSDGRILLSQLLDGDVVSIKISNPREKPLTSNTLPDGCGLEHYGIKTDDIEAAVADLKGRGIRFVQDIVEHPSGVKVAFFLSPDDVLIELLQIPE